MKKSVLVLFVVVSTIISASSQTGVRFSIFANPTINWFESDIKTVKSDGSLIGYDLGLTIDNYFAENYAFTTGLSIGNLGGDLKYVNTTNFETNSNKTNEIPGGTSVKYKLQYLTVPLGLKFKTKEIGYTTFFAHLGLTNQMNIKARASSNDPDPALDNDNVDPEISFFNMGYHIGGGIQYSLGGNTAIVAGLTFTNGFLDITTNKTDKITSSSLALRLGILF